MTIEATVLAIQGDELVLDLGTASGATDGTSVELWRPVKLKHPVTGKMLTDRFHIGMLAIVQIRKTMALARANGALSRPGADVPHPRNYGTFPRVLGEYVRVQKVITLETAVMKMTSMPAKRLGLADRGCIHEGCAADVTVFDPATIADKGTFTEPHQYPVGISYVFVNGSAIVDAGKFTSARAATVSDTFGNVARYLTFLSSGRLITLFGRNFM